MSIVKLIVQEPHKVLRQMAKEVLIPEILTPRTQNLIADMKETLKNTPDGVGLAAPQIGVSLRIFIVSEEAEEIDRARKSGWERRNRETPEIRNDKPYEEREWKCYVYINPVIKNIARKKTEDSEGCLSVRGKYGTVKRHEKITVEAYDESGKKFTRGASNFFARVLQHELDHLEGALFIDRAEKIMDTEK